MNDNPDESEPEMRIENGYSGIALEPLTKGQQVVLEIDGACRRATFLDSSKQVPIYEVISSSVCKGDVVELAGKDTIFHVQED